MDLHRYIAERIHSSARLRMLPPAVVEDVLAAGIEWLAEHSPAETLVSEMNAIDFDACEACGHLVDPDKPEDATRDSEGIVVCNACSVDGGPEAAEPQTIYHRHSCTDACCDQDCDGRGLTDEERIAAKHAWPTKLPPTAADVREKAAREIESMVVGGRAWTDEQAAAAEVLFAAAKRVREMGN